MDIEEELQKLRDVEENFLRTKPNEKKSTEKLLLNFMSSVRISYGEIDTYVRLLRSEKNTVNSLIAVKSCLQSFVDRRGEFNTLISTISTIIAILGLMAKLFWKIRVWATFLLVASVGFIILIWVMLANKPRNNKNVTQAQLLINVIDQVLKEKEATNRSVNEKIAYIPYAFSNENRKFRIKRKRRM